MCYIRTAYKANNLRHFEEELKKENLLNSQKDDQRFICWEIVNVCPHANMSEWLYLLVLFVLEYLASDFIQILVCLLLLIFANYMSEETF